MDALFCRYGQFRNRPYDQPLYEQDGPAFPALHVPAGRGICGCVFQDITPGYGSRDKTMQDHEKLDFLLGTTTDLVFEYNSRTDMLTLVGGGYSRGDRRMITGFPQGLFEEGILRRKDEARLRAEVDKLDGRRQNIQFDIQACLSGDGTYRWYTVNCSEYAERFTGYRCVVGWIKDIEQQRQNRKCWKRTPCMIP